ncbi:hypothetical protein CE91St28_07150 [Pyramidobacter piscolens]|nr:hypothetical protein CE91St28_07150 [Pyramidobacter piscolens]
MPQLGFGDMWDTQIVEEKPGEKHFLSTWIKLSRGLVGSP